MLNALNPEIETDNISSPLSQFMNWLLSDRTRATMTVVTFIFMFAGLFANILLETPAPGSIFYAVAYLAGGVYGVHAGLGALRKRRIDVDLLMVLAAVGALVVGAPFEGAMLLFLFSLSNVLQAFALERTNHAIQALMKLRPDTALVRVEDRLVTMPTNQIRIGDRIIIRPGERIPLDGAVAVGDSTVDQSTLTGESMPVDKQPGDGLYAGTINLHGGLEMDVTRLAKDSALARMIEMVSIAQGRKAHTQRFIEHAEQYYALGVILFTLGMVVVPIVFFEAEFSAAFYRAMGVMVAASPCAVVISTPATVLSAIGNGARRGVLFKGGVHVERAADIKVVALDKTGTLTVGRPTVTDVIALNGAAHNDAAARDELLRLAASIEQKSEHPLARAIVREAEKNGLALLEAENFQSVPGKGIRASIDGMQIYAGSQRFFQERFKLDGGLIETEVRDLQADGKTCVLVGTDVRVEGVIAIADSLRAGVPDAVRRLKLAGIVRTVMLTGDNERTAAAIGELAGLDEVHANLLPDDKMRIIQQLEQDYGPVMMVGDGVNDAPALAAASLSVAMGAAGSDVALETADVVMMGENLSNLAYVIALSHKTRRTLVQNLVFAFAVIFALVTAVLGFSLPLPLSVVGHEGSTVLVSLNGLRLLGFKPGK